MFYTLVYMVFVVDGRSLLLLVIMEISYVLHTCLHGICCRWSKSIVNSHHGDFLCFTHPGIDWRILRQILR